MSVIFSMGVSVDGFVAGPGDTIDWTEPDAELHQFHNDRVRAQGAQICGRKLYETMVYWETADQDPSLDSVGQEFAALWQALPKVVFSSTLTRSRATRGSPPARSATNSRRCRHRPTATSGSAARRWPPRSAISG